MMDMDIFSYLELMKDSLIKKDRILESVIELTRMQEELLDEDGFNEDGFDSLIAKKSELIDEIEKLDEGFDLVYKRVADKIKENPNAYRQIIEKLQELIRILVDKGVEVETAERRNQVKFDLKVAKSRDKIRTYKLNSNAVTKYYSNMSGNTGENNYFLDQKK